MHFEPVTLVQTLLAAESLLARAVTSLATAKYCKRVTFLWLSKLLAALQLAEMKQLEHAQPFCCISVADDELQLSQA